MIDVIGVVANVVCMIVTCVLGIVFLTTDVVKKEMEGVIFGLALVVIGFVAVVESHDYNNQYIPAESLAHNQTQTVFTTDEDTYLADGFYPDGAYLLTVDGKDILVVWQAVDGEVG